MQSPDACNRAATARRSKHSWMPINETEEKERFYQTGQAPAFLYSDSASANKYFTSKKMGEIRFDLYHDAKTVLDKIVKRFGTFDEYILKSLGRRLCLENVKVRVEKYLEERKLQDIVSISYVRNISCSAKLNSTGFSRCLNKPEFRRYNLLINIRSDNIYLREKGIECLLDHELGTHFIRAFNEGLQPWYWNRARFGLSNTTSYESMQIEEGLSTINTMLASKEKFLGGSALLYYATCMANFLSFGQLFDHLRKYIVDKDHRWKHCVRIKRGLKNVNEFGGYAKDQCYFEGAVYLLAYVNYIDFNLLCCGKITIKYMCRIKRIARLHVCQTPSFMSNLNSYKKQLISIAALNEIVVIPRKGNRKENAQDNNLPKLQQLNKQEKPRDIMKISHFLKTKKSCIETLISESQDRTLPIIR